MSKNTVHEENNELLDATFQRCPNDIEKSPDDYIRVKMSLVLDRSISPESFVILAYLYEYIRDNVFTMLEIQKFSEGRLSRKKIGKLINECIKARYIIQVYCNENNQEKYALTSKGAL